MSNTQKKEQYETPVVTDIPPVTKVVCVGGYGDYSGGMEGEE